MGNTSRPVSDGADAAIAAALRTYPLRQAQTARFRHGMPRSFQVTPDGETLVFLRSSGPDDRANALWVHRIGASSSELLFDAAAATEEISDAERVRRERAREQAGGIVSFVLAPDGSSVIFVLGGVIWEVPLDGTRARVIAKDDPVAFDPRVSPDGSKVAFVSGPGMKIVELRAADATSGNSKETSSSPIRMTANDSPTVSWGSAEFVAAEEIGRSRGFWWSGDGTLLAAARVDTAEVASWWVATPAEPDTRPTEIRYPAAGTTNASVELWVIDPELGPIRPVDWQRDEYEYLVSVEWGTSLRCVVQTRDQRKIAYLEADPDTGESNELWAIQNSHWVEIYANTPLTTTLGQVMVLDTPTDRTITIDGATLDLGKWQVRSLVGERQGQILVTATETGIDSQLLAVDSVGVAEVLSKGSGEFTTAVVDGDTVCLARSSATDETEFEILWRDGTSAVIESFASEPGFPIHPNFHAAGKRSLNSALFLPEDHDGSPLPVLVDPYGGPHAQRVLRVRNAHATSQWFAEQGFAVVVTDGRGTPGRGPVFEREVFGDLATPVLDDQIDALSSLAASNPALDTTRVGIRGWSFGGYLAALAVLRRPDVFHAAVAGAPVTDWRLYDTHYTERYLGHPDDYPDSYERSDLMPHAARLERPLMIVHGLGDDNVVAAHSLRLSRALFEEAKDHELVVLSGVSHMTPQERVAENLLHKELNFFRDHLVTLRT